MGFASGYPSSPWFLLQNTIRYTILVLGIAAVSVSPANASGPITYTVTVNTSSVSGTAGSLDFNFNPGPLVTQAASLQILSFTSDGSLAGDCPYGDRRCQR